MFDKTPTVLSLRDASGLDEQAKQRGQALYDEGARELEQLEYERAYDLFKTAATEFGNAKALVKIGYMHQEGYKFPHSIDLAVAYYKKASHQEPSAFRYLAILAITHGIKISSTNNDPQRFIDLAQERGDTNCVRALLLKGMEYFRQSKQATELPA